MVDKQKRIEKADMLAKRTVQILGFGTCFVLITVKLIVPESDIPWWIVLGFFGAGMSGDGAIVEKIGKRK